MQIESYRWQNKAAGTVSVKKSCRLCFSMAALSLSCLVSNSPIQAAPPVPFSPQKAPKAGKAPPASSVTVTFKEGSRPAGFDDTVSPPWLMVPLHGSNYVKMEIDPKVSVIPTNKLRVINNPYLTKASMDLLIPKPENPSLAIGILDVKGLHRGLNGATGVHIEAKDGRAGSLQIGIKRLRSLSVNVILVKDANGHKTPLWDATTEARDLAIAEYIEGANEIWTRQANVQLVLRNVYEFNAPALPSPLALDEKTDWDSLTSCPFSDEEKADKDLYLVWQTTSVADGGTYQDNHKEMVISSYSAHPKGLILAHELAHTFGKAANGQKHSTRREDLLSDDPISDTPAYIRMVEADQANNKQNNPPDSDENPND